MVNPPVTDLHGYANEHLYYEASMFVTARAELLRRSSHVQAGAATPQSPVPNETFTTNMLIEVCVLHFRNLVDFLYPSPKPEPDDITAVHYVQDWGSPLLPPSLKSARTRANKELAHLTSKRLPGEHPDKAWDFADLGWALKPAVEDFLNRVEARNMPARTADALREVGDFILVAEGAVSHGTSTTFTKSIIFGATGPGDWSRG
jgi:hypothetical protein